MYFFYIHWHTVTTVWTDFGLFYLTQHKSLTRYIYNQIKAEQAVHLLETHIQNPAHGIVLNNTWWFNTSFATSSAKQLQIAIPDWSLNTQLGHLPIFKCILSQASILPGPFSKDRSHFWKSNMAEVTSDTRVSPSNNIFLGLCYYVMLCSCCDSANYTWFHYTYKIHYITYKTLYYITYKTLYKILHKNSISF